MKKILILICCIFLLSGCGSSEKERPNVDDYGDLAKEIVGYGDKKVKVYVFAKDGCSHCIEANEYFTELSENEKFKDKFDYIHIQVYDSKWNTSDLGMEALMIDVATDFKDEFNGTPYIVVGEKAFNGFSAAWKTQMEEEINRCYKADECVDPVKDRLNKGVIK